MNPRNKIAILIFADDCDVEASKKNFSRRGGSKTNGQISAMLTSAAQKLAYQAGYPVFRIGSDQQHGANFGEKITNAFDTVFKKGYEKVIAIGNDCLGLSLSLLKRAADQLSINDFVYGRASDGGCFLIGLTKSTFDKKKLTALPWQTTSLYEAILEHSRPGKVSQLLPVLHDCDQEADVYKNSSSASLAAVILNIINWPIKQLVQKSNPYNAGCVITLLLLRAPPVL